MCKKEREIFMKKIVTMLVCVSLVFPMCIPAFANQQEDYQLPPGVVLSEGEVWIPAEDGIMPFGYEDEVGPVGFSYAGQIRGNYVVDLVVGSAVDASIIASIPELAFAATGVTITIPASVGIIYGLATGFLSYYMTPKTQQEDYIRLIFTCDDPYAYCGFAYPYINYYLVSYYVTLKDRNGNTRTVCAESKELYEYALLP